MSKIVVVDYDPTWPAVFESLREHVSAVVAPFALSIEHIGSTSVPGLAAKPIIDLSIVVPSYAELPQAIDALACLGYEHLGDLGIEGREAFQPPADLPPHHLYVCPQGSLGLRNHLALRDYLRGHPEAATAYGKLKKALSKQFPHDIDAYVDGKTEFIVGILAEMGFSEEELKRIDGANRTD
ncbi:GrpB family protein [Aeoliella sp.]|uniref:GrpB family protein n=1 Tax=Aeoliella sp. TaxID=2795800 RepID=UPI003CCBCEBA